MLTTSPHLFDDATRVTAGDSRWQGRTSADYWAFVGPFGGATAATILRALIDHPQRAGDPLALSRFGDVVELIDRPGQAERPVLVVDRRRLVDPIPPAEDESSIRARGLPAASASTLRSSSGLNVTNSRLSSLRKWASRYAKRAPRLKSASGFATTMRNMLKSFCAPRR